MRRRSTRRNYTVEAALVEAAFTVADDIAHRTAAGTARVALLLWTACGILAGLTVVATLALWHRVHPHDRRAAAAGVATVLRTFRSGVPTVLRTLGRSLLAACRWCDRQACHWIRLAHDAILAELERSRRREERIWLALRERPAEEPEADEYEPLWQDEGCPVGERKAA